MAVMDFREGGFGFTFSRQRGRRDHDFEERGWDESPGADAAPPVEGLPVRLARLTHYLGALISVGLMIGLLFWGWQLVMRDVSGIPVIKALAGQARTAPDEPGGELTAYTGLAVNDVAAGSRSTPATEVAIAPAATSLADGDVPMGQLGATAREPATDSDLPVSFDTDPVIAQSDADIRAAEALAEAEAEAQAAVAAAAVTDAPASDGSVNAAVLDENGEQAQAAAINDALAQAQAGGGLTASARPAPRPRRAAAVATAAATPAPAPAAATAGAAPAARPAAEPAATEPAPVRRAAPASGAALVQIGAFDSNAIAEGEWGRLSGKFGSLFSGKGPVIQEHRANGRTFWRLRVAGFDTREDARRFCEALKSGGTDCIPATAQ